MASRGQQCAPWSCEVTTGDEQRLQALLGGRAGAAVVRAALSQLGGLYGVLRSPVAVLRGVGLTAAQAKRIIAAREAMLAPGRPAGLVSLTSPDRVVAVARALTASADSREFFAVLALDARMRLLKAAVIAQGTVGSCPVHVREIMNYALRQGATAIILVHNHPSGDPDPSAADWALTRRAKRAGDLVGVVVLDHVIVAGRRYTSLAEEGPL